MREAAAGQAHPVVERTVKVWYDDGGWGALTSLEVSGVVFAHLSHQRVPPLAAPFSETPHA
jgi:hypothetical protein